MEIEFISKKDKIIAAAIEIISESGLSALTTKNLAMKENMQEGLLYKYYGDINEVLIDIIEFYSKFDKTVQKTVLAKSGGWLDRIMAYVEMYATYYDNYYAISTIMLQYEELLHNIYTRDKIAEVIKDRRKYVAMLFQEAIDAGELTELYTAEELANQLTGTIMVLTLDRRINYHRESFKTEIIRYVGKALGVIKK